MATPSNPAPPTESMTKGQFAAGCSVSLVLLAILVGLGWLIFSQCVGSSDTTVPIADDQIERRPGLGVHSRTFQSFFEEPYNGGFLFESSVLDDGTNVTTGISPQTENMMILMGPSEDLSKASFAIPDSVDGYLDSLLRMQEFLEMATPGWGARKAWLLESFPVVMGTGSSVQMGQKHRAVELTYVRPRDSDIYFFVVTVESRR